MNPEFQRNLWLEASPKRIAWAAAMLAGYFLCAFVFRYEDGPTALATAGGGAFCFCAGVWGLVRALRAVNDEVALNTWDFQRLSALDPWSMTWGKLFGATSLSWMCALTGLLVLIASARGANVDPQAVWPAVLILISGALLLQAGTMALTLVGVRRARAQGRDGGSWFTLGGIVAIPIVAGVVARTAPGQMGRGWSLLELIFGGPTLEWWGMTLHRGWFAGLSLALFALFALVAAWRLMRLELQMRNFPWAWPLFVALTGLWCAGLAGEAAALRWAAAGYAFAACAYVSAFAEPTELTRIRQFVAKLAAGDWRSAAYDAPTIIAPVKLTALATLGVVLSGAGSLGPPPSFAFAALAFMIRDLGIVAYFRFRPPPWHGDLGAVFALVIAYFIGGALDGALGAILVPGPSIASLLAGASMAAIVWALAWRHIRGPDESKAQRLAVSI